MQPYQNFFHQFISMYRPLINKANNQLTKYQLYTSQWAILNLLYLKGPHTNVEIANHQNVEKPTITRMIQRLEELNYVELVPGKDRREKKIQLTDYGMEICAEIKLMIKELEIDALRGITETEQEEVSRVLATVRENLLK